MDLNKLTTGDQIIGVSGILLFIFSFFSWLGYKGTVTLNGASRSNVISDNAWGFTLTLFAVLLGLVLVAYVVLKALSVEIPGRFGSVTLAQIVLGVAALAFIFVLIKVITGPSGNTTGTFIANAAGSASISKSRRLGIFLGLIATIGLVAGAFLNFQAEQASTGPSTS